MNTGLLKRVFGTGDDGPGPTTLSLDDLWGMCNNQRRREVITHLADGEGLITLGELAEAIAFIESDHDHIDEVTASERKRVYVGLYQCHLPKMVDVGLVEWDGNGDIEPTPDCYNLAEIIKAVRRMNGGVA